jgi:ribonucleoside-diphosphate reductase alpha chain
MKRGFYNLFFYLANERITGMNENAKTILKERYLQQGESVEGMFRRVAKTIAKAETVYGSTLEMAKEWETAFFEIMNGTRFLPNSPTLMNAGVKNKMQYSACYVLPVNDNIPDIFDAIKHSAIIHKSGGGTGFSFSDLRPKGSLVRDTIGVSSGPVSFLKVFDSATEAIKQGGKRRGANMGVLRVDHPDIEDFIMCKRDGGIHNFNVSIAITDAFMQALINGDDYEILAQPGWPNLAGGEYEGREIIGHKNSKEIFDKIIECAWQTGDPGVIFIDRINDSPANPTPELEHVKATNPCGEVPLYENEACNIGSINLTKFVMDGDIDWEALDKTIRIAVRFLDNVITVNPYPLLQMRNKAKENRRIGLGVMGWADLLFMLGIEYGSLKSLELASRLMSFIREVARDQSQMLGKIRGSFKNFGKSIYQEVLQLRNATLTTIAPTGSISIIAGVSGGIEPVFALAYEHSSQEVDGAKRKLSFINPVLQHLIETEKWPQSVVTEIVKTGSLQHINHQVITDEIKRIFVTAHDIPLEKHVQMQAAFQKHTDNAVSKTINLKAEATREDVRKAYLLAYDLGCLGITVFRDRCLTSQVLNAGIQPTSKFKKRPGKIEGVTYRKQTSVGTAYVTINEVDKEPFEVFVNVGKAGSDVAADAEGIGRLISLILRDTGTMRLTDKIQNIVTQLTGIGGSRQIGFGKDRVLSLVDGIAQVLGEHCNIGTGKGLPELEGAEDKTGDICPECGNAQFVYEEGCKKCFGCGFSLC